MVADNDPAKKYLPKVTAPSPTLSTKSDSDPARRYLPEAKTSPSGARKKEPSNQGHGPFTSIAYGTAWATGLIGSVVAAGIMVSGQDQYGDAVAFLLGLAVFLGSWISAAGIGTLAEISMKLTPSDNR